MAPKQKKQPAPEPTPPSIEDLSPMLQAIFKAEAQEAVSDAYHGMWALLRMEYAKACDRMFPPDPATARHRAATAVVVEATVKSKGPFPSRKAMKAAYAAAEQRLEAMAPKAKAKAPKASTGAAAGAGAEACNVKGCSRPRRSMGYCGAHYQAARKHGWPRPCPLGFEAGPVERQRPAANEAAK